MGQASSVSSPLQCALPVPLARLPPSFKDADQRDQWAAKEVDRRRRQQRHEDQEEKARRADDAKADRNDEGEGDDGADANSAAGGAAGGSGPDPGCSCVRQQHAMRKLVRMGAEAAVVAPAEGGVDAGPSELVLAFQSLAPLLRSLELRPAATVTSVSASSSVAAAAAVAAADPILPRVDTPLPRSSGGLESFRRQTAEGAAGRSESESQSQCQSQSQSQLQSARVCALLLSCASELAELERLDWTLPLPAAALFAPPPTAAALAKQHRSRKLAYSTVGTPDYIAPEGVRAERLRAGVRLVFAGRAHARVSGRLPALLRGGPAVDVPQDRQLEEDTRLPRRGQALPGREGPHPAVIGSAGPKLPNGLRLGQEASLSCPKVRLTFEQLEAHRFFAGMDWNSIRQARSPIVPNVTGELDTHNCDKFEDLTDEQLAADEANALAAADEAAVGAAGADQSESFIGRTFKRVEQPKKAADMFSDPNAK